ncbi:hypothetical protein GCM10023081_27650 [Arthrobacter ginkgonis]|uniref:4'-phosphopantetheinyl transferase domain-containing protein n=1 Tax=Arthrobacter ginkgonis TaxID=1630594 RepID=A0ABP7CEA8_9MICC
MTSNPRPATIRYAFAAPAEVRTAVAALGGYAAVLGAEAGRAAGLRVEEDAEALLASRALLRLLAAHVHTGSAASAALVKITRRCSDCGATDHGKPEADGAAVSLSRTRTLVMAAVGPAGTVLGIDVERTAGPERTGLFDGFDALVLSPAERGLLAAATAPDLLRMAAWTAKEAVLKATGDGLRVEPHRLTVLDPALAEHSALAGPAGALQLPDGTFPVSAPTLPAAGAVRVRWVDAGSAHLAAIASAPALPVLEVALAELALPGAG